MGGSVSKSTIVGNQKTLAKLDQTLSDILTSTLKKYSEMVDNSISAAHQANIDTFRKRGVMMPDIPKPKLSVHEVFKGKCTKDVVILIHDKLQRFPKWALINRGFLFSSKKPVPFALQDTQSMTKEQLCMKMAELYTALLLSIEIVVRSLYTCRQSIDTLSTRLDNAFVTKAKDSRDPIHNTPANEQWFKSMDQLQQMYKKHATEAKKLFNSLDTTNTLDSQTVDKFKMKLGTLNNKMQALPAQCSMLFDQIDRTPTIGKALADECKTLKVSPKACSKAMVAVKKQEQKAKTTLREAKKRAMGVTDK